MDDRVPLIALLSSRLRREIDALLDSETAYADISDFLTTAAWNQLSLDKHMRSPGQVGQVRQESATHHLTVSEPSPVADLTGAELLQVVGGGDIPSVPLDPIDDGLPFLCNRLYVFPVVVRMVAWLTMTNNEGYPTFVDGVTTAARALGMRLKEEDRRHRRSALQRRSVGWPIGAELAKSRDRFMFGYGIEPNGTGPLRTLGLADVRDGRVVLSERGADLARVDVPLLGEGHVGDATLSEGARSVLESALLDLPSEVTEMARLFRTVGDGAPQQEVDAALRDAHPGWSEGLAASHRAALVGRLRDLEVITVDSRGPKALVRATPQGDAFVKRVLEVDERNEEGLR